MAIDVECGVVGAVSAVGERVVALEGDADGLSVLDVEGTACGICEREVVEDEVGLVVAVHEERAVGGGAREGVGDLLLECFALRYADVGAADVDGDEVCDVACHDDTGCLAAVADTDGVVGDVAVVDADLADAAGVVGFAFNGQRVAAGDRHVARVGCPMCIGDLPYAHVHGLCRGCDGSEQQEADEENYLFHTLFTWCGVGLLLHDDLASAHDIDALGEGFE